MFNPIKVTLFIKHIIPKYGGPWRKHIVCGTIVISLGGNLVETGKKRAGQADK